LYDNQKLAENIFSYLATPPVTPDQPSHKEMAMKTPAAPAEEHPPATLKDTTDMPTLPNAEIAEKTPVEQETAIIEAPNTVVPEPQKAEQAVIPKAPAQSPAKVEQEIDKLDEQLAFGEIDETTYEVEKRKVKGDLTGLNQLMKEGRITLAKYMEARVIIHSRSSEKPLKAQCSACGESLMGIETFCPNCGEKNQ